MMLSPTPVNGAQDLQCMNMHNLQHTVQQCPVVQSLKQLSCINNIDGSAAMYLQIPNVCYHVLMSVGEIWKTE